MNNLDPLKTIIEKFLAWNSECKDWSFEDDRELNDVRYPYIVITTRILDSHNNHVQLFAQIYPCDCCNEFTVKITDAGFIAKEHEDLKKEYLFSDPLTSYVELNKFNEGIEYYFEVFRLAGKQIGFHEIDLIAEAAVRKNDNGYTELEKIVKKN